jgi:hypothetical protein
VSLLIRYTSRKMPKRLCQARQARLGNMVRFAKDYASLFPCQCQTAPAQTLKQSRCRTMTKRGLQLTKANMRRHGRLSGPAL